MTDSYYWDGVRYHGTGHVVIVTIYHPQNTAGTQMIGRIMHAARVPHYNGSGI